MRRGIGGRRSYGWGAALCATWACGGALRPPVEQHVVEPTCVPIETPSAVADTATIAFSALAATRDACALTLVAETLRPWPTATADRWTVQITLTPAGATARRLGRQDARDAIDAGAVLIATDDLDLAAYAAARADLEIAPLPWDRTYALLSPLSIQTLGGAVAPDAVGVDARPAESLVCAAIRDDAAADTATRRTAQRIVYDARDPTARALAERIVALAERRDVTAVGVGTAELNVMLRAGDELAYIVSVPRSRRCDVLLAMAGETPWIATRSIVPLIDTRAYSIAPRARRP